MNGILLTTCTLALYLSGATKFEIEKDSAIIFSQAPIKAKDSGIHIPVPPVPDMQDAAVQQMHAMFEDWAVSLGLKKPQPGHDATEGFDDDELNDEDFEMDFPLDEDDYYEDVPPGDDGLIPDTVDESPIDDEPPLAEPDLEEPESDNK